MYFMASSFSVWSPLIRKEDEEKDILVPRLEALTAQVHDGGHATGRPNLRHRERAARARRRVLEARRVPRDGETELAGAGPACQRRGRRREDGSPAAVLPRVRPIGAHPLGWLRSALHPASARSTARRRRGRRRRSRGARSKWGDAA